MRFPVLVVAMASLLSCGESTRPARAADLDEEYAALRSVSCGQSLPVLEATFASQWREEGKLREIVNKLTKTTGNRQALQAHTIRDFAAKAAGQMLQLREPLRGCSVGVVTLKEMRGPKWDGGLILSRAGLAKAGAQALVEMIHATPWGTKGVWNEFLLLKKTGGQWVVVERVPGAIA
jgi:hypothetical protein